MIGRREAGHRESGRREAGRRETGRRETGRRPEGASQSRADLRDQYHAWIRHHRLSAADSLFRVLDNPVSSVLTWLVIGIALALPVGLNVALDNVSRLSASFEARSSDWSGSMDQSADRKHQATSTTAPYPQSGSPRGLRCLL